MPVFSPQATIQHPLEWTIELYFALFPCTSSEMQFVASLPFGSHFKKSFLDSDYIPIHAEKLDFFN
jgi:hypothetical protein